MSTIYVGYDHAGYDTAQVILDSLRGSYPVEDEGPGEYAPEDDYPEVAIPLAEKVADEDGARGILVCGSGQGMAMAANKVPGVRASHHDGFPEGSDVNPVSMARRHNDANVLALSGDQSVLDAEDAVEAVRIFLETEFSGEERHRRRIEQMETYENDG